MADHSIDRFEWADGAYMIRFYDYQTTVYDFSSCLPPLQTDVEDHPWFISALEELAAARSKILKLEAALRCIAGTMPWPSSDMGFVDLARAALKESGDE